MYKIIFAILLSLVIMGLLIASIIKSGSVVNDTSFVTTDTEEINKICEQLKIGRARYNKLMFCLILFGVIGCSPFIIVRNVYSDIISFISLILCVAYGYRKYKSIVLPPCPYCGTKDCLISPGTRNPFLNPYCRECHTILVK